MRPQPQTWLLVVALLAGLGLGRCDQAQGPLSLVRSQAGLVQVQDCGQLVETLRAGAIAEMEAALDRNLETALESGGMCMYDYGGGYPNAVPTAGGGAPPYEQGGAREYSTTNTQVVGVDEADFVKNDGQFIYVLADGRFQILAAWPPAELHVLSATAIEGIPRKLFVHARRAVVYSALDPLPAGAARDFAGYYGFGGDTTSDSYRECTYGYDCDFRGDGRALKITVLDLAQPEAPTVLRELRFGGSLINARRINNAVHTVLSAPAAALADVRYWPEELDACNESLPEAEIRAQFSELRAKNRALINAAALDAWLPQAEDLRYAGGGEPVREQGALMACDQYYVAQQQDGQDYLALVSFDLTTLADLRTTTVVGRPGAVYASTDALFVASRHEQQSGQPWFFGANTEGAPAEASTVHKFNLQLDPPAAGYAGSGVVKGRVLSQFAMDERDGYLRIATTTGHVPDPAVHSTVSVLAAGTAGLETIGAVDNLAPGEDIRAVRFDGARGFIVTFKKTDPLFVLDLATPTSPYVAGELKIPGFSTYLHMLDETHLLSIGFDAEDQGDFAYFQGILLQVFDVTDPGNPQLTHREVIGTRGSTSEAATNHLAFNYFAPKDLLALPMVVCEGGSGGNFADELTFSGLMVYRVTASGGFTYLGGVPHVPAGSPPAAGYESQGCGYWWSDAQTAVKRSIVMDDYVFSVAEDGIDVAELSALRPSNDTPVVAHVGLAAE